MRVPELDGVRGLAIALVLTGHLFNSVLPEGGAIGVSLFFALSGYLITSILVAELKTTGRISLPNFYLRRARRLLPALVLMLTAFAVWAWIAGWGPLKIAKSTLPVLFYSANFSGAFGWGVGHHMDHTWSLAVEEQFYLAWPLVLPLVMPALWTLGLAVLVVLSRYAVVALGIPADPIYTLLRYDEILLGCVIALSGLKVSKSAGYIALLGLVAVSALPGARAVLNNAGYFLIAILCACVVSAAPTIGILRFPVLRHLGMVSYGLYLWHYPIWVITGNSWATLLLTGVISEASWRWVERPILKR